MSKIAALMLDELKEAIAEKLIIVKYDTAICDYLAKECVGKKRGAREIRNLIRREIESKIVDIIIDNAEGTIKEINITAKADKIDITFKKA